MGRELRGEGSSWAVAEVVGGGGKEARREWEVKGW